MAEKPRELRGEEIEETGPETWTRRLNEAREHSTELQKDVQEIQSAKLGTTLLRLMERSGDNTKIVNNLNEFLDALDHQSFYGDSSRDLGAGRQQDLADFLGATAKSLRWIVGGGNRTSETIDLSRWSDK